MKSNMGLERPGFNTAHSVREYVDHYVTNLDCKLYAVAIF